MATNQLTTCQTSEAVGLERTRFFPRQLITPDDLTQDQIYFREKSRRHNRMLHGWGVVCGARVMPAADPCQIVVEAGYVLGPFGDEIIIDQNITVDLCHEGLDGFSVSPCGDSLDPWCSNIRINRRPGVVYVAVCYAECQTRPVRAQANGCGCSEAECEYSRIRDSFAIKVLTSLPTTYADPMPRPSSRNILSCPVADDGTVMARVCPPCPTEPWVILADVTLNADGSVEDINCFAHRRYVASFAEYYFLCEPEDRLSYTAGRAALVDRTAEAAGAGAANVLVSVARRDGSSVYAPIYFRAAAGETYASLLAREGSRQYYDPDTGESFTLRDLYAMSQVNLQDTVRSTAEAVAPLESITLRVGELNRTRTNLVAELDQAGLQRLDDEHGGVITAAAQLPVTAISGVSPRSTLGRRVSDRTIADVATLSRTAFIEQVTTGVAANRRTALENQAGEVWDSANTVVNLTRAWRA